MYLNCDKCGGHVVMARVGTLPGGPEPDRHVVDVSSADTSRCTPLIPAC
jgi:hypothetical protein